MNRCYDCLTTEVSVKLIDLCGFEHWFCARCWEDEMKLRDAVQRKLGALA